MFGPKIYAACGAAGFGLSFLVGLFCGAGFPLVLIRALVFGVVFAGLAAAFNAVFHRFLPEIFDDIPPSPGKGAPEPGVGVSLDVTVGDHDEAAGDVSGETDAGFVRDNLDRSVNAGVSGPVESEPASGEESLPADAVFSGNAVPDFSAEDVEETEREESGDEGAEKDAEDIVFSETVPESVSPAAVSTPISPDNLDAPPPSSQDGLDVLPDVSDFAEAGVVDEDTDIDGSSYAKPDFASGFSSGASGFGEKPEIEAETMAKAIRSVLSKE